MKSLQALTLVLTATLTSAALAQQPDKYHLHLDPATTEVHYTLKDTVHTVKGTFHLTSGDIVFSPGSGQAHGQFSVNTGSGASGNDTRDGRMKRDFLEVPKFPVATFDAQKVTGYNPSADNQTISVDGTMTLHGAGHPLTLTFAVTRNGTEATATTHFVIPYVAWGIKDPSIPFIKVEKEVAMDIVAKGTLSTEK
jgi:polyisoprenoid-binding protein YceI